MLTFSLPAQGLPMLCVYGIPFLLPLPTSFPISPQLPGPPRMESHWI